MTTLYLVRHGETEENASHILQGHLPGNLSSKGIQQLESLQQELNTIHFDITLCSDLKRCIDSANILMKDRYIPIIYLKMLRERDWGSFTGKSIPDIQSTPFPNDVESVNDLLLRAKEFLDYIKINHQGKSILAVSHGLFCRAIRSVHSNTPMKNISPMQNATYHILTL